tara:strand:- start:197 stop:1165 length:969 start_codon:yes stop_codon:yes gene_type:complete
MLFYLLLLPFCFAFIQRPRIVKTKYYASPTLWDVLSNNLKENARNWFIQRAERSGIDWNAITYRYEKDLDKLDFIYQQVNNNSMVYPSYYTRPFHGYDDGNLNWLAALEGEAATLSMAVNYWKGNDPTTTENWLRYNITQNLLNYINKHGGNKPKDVLDVGSSVGISTEYLLKSLKDCKRITGMDLSPYFVALATYRAKEERLPITYIHRNAEEPDLQEDYDVIICTFILHEVPKEPTKVILNALKKHVKPGGTFAVIDLDQTKVQNNLIVSTFRKWAFEVTEPHIYEYYQTNMTELMMEAGFKNVEKVPNDPINSLWMGRV